MGELVLVTGGARSGKSAFAERWASARGGDRVLFVATAQAGDAEMAERIAAHRASRPRAWRTIEAQREVAAAIASAGDPEAAVIVDCVTLLASNLLLAAGTPAAAREALLAEVAGLLRLAEERRGGVLVVTNEVGLGIVPDNVLARTFRDLLGEANQRLAQAAASVYLLTAGIPLVLKGPGPAI